MSLFPSRQLQTLCVCSALLFLYTVSSSGQENSLNAALSSARAFSEQGRYQDALPIFQDALKAFENQPVSPTLASLTNETAVTHFRLGQLEEAESLYREAILIYQTTEPRDEAGLATSLNNLAALHHRQRDFESAEPLYQRALELRRKTQGLDHPDVAFSLNELAMLYHSQRRLEEATELYVQSLAIEEKILGSENPELAPRLTNLAVLYRLQGLFNRAEPLFRRALDLQRQSLGADHPDVALAINNLAVLYSVMGRYDEAETLYQQVLSIQQKAFGEGHISFAVSLRNLAILFGRKGDSQKARETALQIRDILDENCSRSSAAALSEDDRAVCQNALAMQQHLITKLGIDLDADPPEPSSPSTQTASTVSAASNGTGLERPSSHAPPQSSPAFRAQVRSFHQKNEAEQDLRLISETYADVLANYPGRVQQVDLGSKGTWYRVQFGAFETSAAAQKLCKQLTDQGLESCWVAKTTR